MMLIYSDFGCLEGRLAGRTSGFGPENAGSNPALPAKKSQKDRTKIVRGWEI